MDHLSFEQLRALLTVALAHSKRDWLFLLITYWHGLRVSETLSLTPRHLRDEYLTIERLKGSLKTSQPLMSHPDPLFNEKAGVAEYMAGMKDRERLFPFSRQYAAKLIGKYGHEAGIRAGLTHMHVLKHSIAMHSIASAGIENVKQYLGHKSLGSTGMYLRVSDAAASSAVMKAVKERG
jgi:integrase